MTSPLSSSTGLIESNVASNQFNSMDSIALITKQLVARAKEERAEDNRVYGAFYNGVLKAEELENIRKVFALYVTFPKNRWKEIRQAETDEILFNKLMQEYKSKELFNRNKRENGIIPLHENISAQDIFINDDGTVVM